MTGLSQSIDYNYIIIGSGIAGLNTALLAAEHGSVLVVTKGRIDDCNSRYAQGGIAAAIGPGDLASLHERDTLADRVRGSERITVLEYTHAIRICVEDGAVTGVEVMSGRDEIATAQAPRNDNHRRVIQGDVVVVSTGGAGRLYRYTTNPEVATGDGVALAHLAGAEVMDMEFYQFHPTALWLEGAPTFLLSEAMRGEGAILRNADGEPFMSEYHPMADLAPRDVVSRAIAAEMERADGDAGHIAPAGGHGNQPVPDDLRRVPPVRAGHHAGAHTGGAGGPLHDGRRAHRHLGADQRPGPVRLRRGGLRGGARGQPAGQQLAAGHAGVLPPAGGGDAGQRAGLRAGG